jgi:hypothetical protein
MLTYEHEKRPSAEELLQHPWIVEMSESKIDKSLAQGALSNLKGFKV